MKKIRDEIKTAQQERMRSAKRVAALDKEARLGSCYIYIVLYSVLSILGTSSSSFMCPY